MNEVGKIPSSNTGSEFIVQNTGTDFQYETLSLDKGDDIKMESSGATIYDPSVAKELQDKYKGDPNLHIFEKNHIKLNRFGKSRFSYRVRMCNHAGCFELPLNNYCEEHQEFEL